MTATAVLQSHGTRAFAERTAALAVRSLLREAEAAPKPGLVDRFGPGVHPDMDIGHFRRSAAALGPYFARMAGERRPAALRQLGLQAEAAMLAATGGVNTHKGVIWSMGLLCAAAGSCSGRSRLEAELVCDRAADMATAILSLSPASMSMAPVGTAGRSCTHGQAACLTYGLRSARDEAAAGFPSIRAAALPLARSLLDARAGEDETVIRILLAVMAHADDTCIAYRGGIEALHRTRMLAETVLGAGGPDSTAGKPIYRGMLREFAEDRLSPGGSADLCAATLFLVDLESSFDR
jgi:triphosphoribosyl-dephospho-CoA synthase